MTRAKLPAAWRRLHDDERRHRSAMTRVRSTVRANGTLAPHESARVIGLRYVNDQRMPGIRRIGRQRRFRYVDPSGRSVSDPADRQRIRALAIPPAWTDVWICPDPRGHLQATGRDARGRKQYRYHPKWRDVRDEVKYGRLIAFAEALPRIRTRTRANLRKSGLPREKVLAAVVQLLEKTLIRVGNEEYARENGSVGLTTMRDEHAKVRGGTVRFEFRGKSRIEHAIDLHDARLARIVKACRDLPGYELFQYIQPDGSRQVIDSADVNAYLREISGQDFTAKDFRTWAGTVLAAKALVVIGPCRSQSHGKRNIGRAVESVARRLGNTKTVCRKCYIHPAILDSYLDGTIVPAAKRRPARQTSGRATLSADEAAVVELIERATIARSSSPAQVRRAHAARAA
jgi:DNA topoisomerase-1